MGDVINFLKNQKYSDEFLDKNVMDEFKEIELLTKDYIKVLVKHYYAGEDLHNVIIAIVSCAEFTYDKMLKENKRNNVYENFPESFEEYILDIFGHAIKENK